MNQPPSGLPAPSPCPPWAALAEPVSPTCCRLSTSAASPHQRELAEPTAACPSFTFPAPTAARPSSTCPAAPVPCRRFKEAAEAAAPLTEELQQAFADLPDSLADLQAFIDEKVGTGELAVGGARAGALGAAVARTWRAGFACREANPQSTRQVRHAMICCAHATSTAAGHRLLGGRVLAGRLACSPTALGGFPPLKPKPLCAPTHAESLPASIPPCRAPRPTAC